MSQPSETKPVPAEPPIPRLLTIGYAARDANISERKMRQLALDGRIRTVRIGRCVRVPREELERLVREGV